MNTNESEQAGGSGDADTEGAVSWGELYTEAVQRFEANDIENPSGSARRIVDQAAGFEPLEFPLNQGNFATVRGVAHLDAMVARRLAGEPLQYVVGNWGFRLLDLAVDKRVLIPRPETEEVVGWALELVPSADAIGGRVPLVVDLGTGSGAVGLSVLAEVPRAEVWLTDVSASALTVTRANLAGLGRVATRGRVAQGSWFEALPDDMAGSVDLVISNPPYVAESDYLPDQVKNWEPAGALVAGPRGTEDVEHLLQQAPDWLTPSGSIVIEMAPNQVADMANLASDLFVDVSTRVDLSGRMRAVVATTRRAS